ncbi:E3 ubiquitin-protein ligase rnf168-like [Festucalex cinctus]
MLPDPDADLAAPTASRGKREETLSLDNCLCPVCLDLFLEPVTLPCTHTFCKGCFLESVDKTTLCCPLCRKRVSTWVRQNNKNKTLVNQQLWTQIQVNFPQHCQRRLSGQDAVKEDDVAGTPDFASLVLVSKCLFILPCARVIGFPPRMSQPGELRQEYQDQISKLSEEKRELDEEEQRASEEYIRSLLAEEEMLVQEERRRSEEDERLARVLSEELNAAPVSQDNRHPAAKKKVNTVGHIEKFLCRLPSKSSTSDCSSASTLISNKENIFLSPGHRLPHVDLYGTQRDHPEPSGPGPASQRCRSRHHADEGTSKRKSYDDDDDDDDEEAAKRGCRRSPPSSSSSSSSSSPLEGTLLLHAELEARLDSRRQQEAADWEMALLLQEELNQEKKQQQTDRSKGSADAYPLRRKAADARRRNSWTKISLPSLSSASSSFSSLEASTSSSHNGDG